MKKRLWAAAIVAAAGATVLIAPTAGAHTCDGPGSSPGLYQWQVQVSRANVWESENYAELETSLRGGVIVRGYGGRRPSGWVPVINYDDGSGFKSLLEGPNDTKDFMRSSTLEFLGCV